MRADPRFRPGAVELTLGVALFLVLCGNASFWRAVLAAGGHVGIGKIGFLFSIGVLLVTLLNLILSPFGFRFLLKPAAITLLLTSSVVAYFMDAYGVLFDRPIVQSVLATDAREATELLGPRLLLYVFLLGVLPSLIVARVPVAYRPFRCELTRKLGVLAASLAVAAGLVLIRYQGLASLTRNHRELRHLVNPASFLSALAGCAREALDAGSAGVVPIGQDARRRPRMADDGKKTVVVLVVGETARADRFSLNGYTRPTNSHLAQEEVFSFLDVHSCGTATAVSLPCMFSMFGSAGFRPKGKDHESLLDVLRHAGVSVLWRDNNTGCKGVCDRVTVQSMSDLCGSQGCYDEILLEGLGSYIRTVQNDTLIVLHQQGSHGPAYHERYPRQFSIFGPECATNQLQDCSREEIGNAYDNTILYTDYQVSKVVQLLKEVSDRYDTAMVYVSDHGESLGEHGLYLHGLPYFIAPDEQTHVPLIVWLSPGFRERAGIDAACLKATVARRYSHDNLFHSILGLMDVESETYLAEKDLFRECTRDAALVRSEPLEAPTSLPTSAPS